MMWSGEVLFERCFVGDNGVILLFPPCHMLLMLLALLLAALVPATTGEKEGSLRDAIRRWDVMRHDMGGCFI